MKKLLVGLIVLFSLALMGCPQSEYPVTGYINIKNRSDYDYRFMVDYNQGLKSNDNAFLISAKTWNLRNSYKGKYYQSEIDANGDDITIYMIKDEDWEYLQENDFNGYTDYYIMMNAPDSYKRIETVNGRSSKYYTIDINNTGIDVSTEPW